MLPCHWICSWTVKQGDGGLKKLDLEAFLTGADQAEEFARRKGVHFLAPSFANIHGVIRTVELKRLGTLRGVSLS